MATDFTKPPTGDELPPVSDAGLSQPGSDSPPSLRFIKRWLCCGFGLLTAAVAAAGQPPAAPWLSWPSPAAIEARLAAVEAELGRLANPRPVPGVGPIGHRSAAHATADHLEWIEVDLGETVAIDGVVVVPTLFHRPDSTLEADGFPENFRLLAHAEGQDEPQVLASFTAADGLLPRRAPLVIDCPPTPATRVRLEATRLGPRAWDGLFCLQLAELLVFAGADNVALNCPVDCSSDDDNPEAARNAAFIVDGFLPYLLDAPGGKRSTAFMTHLRGDDPCSLTIDLGESHQLDGLRLHAADVSDNVPQSHANDFGIPRHLRVEAAAAADFAAATRLVEHTIGSALAAGPIISLRFPPTACRFVRLTSLVPSRATHSDRPCFGCAELECLVAGRNVAAGKPVSTSLPAAELSRADRLQAVTDSSNYYGPILPLRLWLSQLARRHELERGYPQLREELAASYRSQSLLVQRLILLSLLLAAVVVAVIAVGRTIRQRAIDRTREQIAADLHDELGANLQAIALCGDLAARKTNSPEQLAGLLERLRELAARGGKAAKACVNLLESDRLYEGFAAELQRASSRLLADLDHTLEIEGEEHLATLPPRIQIGVALFYKECLANIIRHSGATHVATEVVARPAEIVLTVADNGYGLQGLAGGPRSDLAPASLRRRARLLGGSVVVADRTGGGLQVTLRARTRSRWQPLPFRSPTG